MVAETFGRPDCRAPESRPPTGSAGRTAPQTSTLISRPRQPDSRVIPTSAQVWPRLSATTAKVDAPLCDAHGAGEAEPHDQPEGEHHGGHADDHRPRRRSAGPQPRDGDRGQRHRADDRRRTRRHPWRRAARRAPNRRIEEAAVLGPEHQPIERHADHQLDRQRRQVTSGPPTTRRTARRRRRR